MHLDLQPLHYEHNYTIIDNCTSTFNKNITAIGLFTYNVLVNALLRNALTHNRAFRPYNVENVCYTRFNLFSL